ncbi:condensation domain-containing protein, partial [Shimazuella sp. AN120528]|uniref:condensation domain-containing protein n=1 Tax=Shimazuella soli TaxID=1892854 RepID=UPI001F0F53E8
AYVQGKGEPAVWQRDIAAKLPDYMVPAVFQVMEAFPLTANGKIDRKALPEPVETRKQAYAAAETDTEATLIEIWESLLGRSPIGIHDNFFQLGGDSILSIQVVSRAREKGILLKPKQLFAHQTIATLAQVAQTEAPVVGEQGILSGEVPFVPIQKWFLEQTEHPHHFNQSMLLKVGEAKEAWLRQAIREVVKYHDALRMRFVPTETGWKQYYRAESEEELEVVDLRGKDHPLALLEKRTEEAQASLHLSEGPVFRAIWFRLSEGEGRLFLLAHHLVMDGVSWRIILEDIETIYQQLAANKPVQVPQKTSSYRQWAEYLRKFATSKEIENKREQWQQVKDTVIPQDQFGRNTEDSVEHVQLLLTTSETEQLLSKTTARTHATVEEILLTALVQSLQKWTGENTHTIHLEGHGREEQEELDLSRTVGWFTSLYPVMFRLQSTSMGEAIQVVKETLRDRSKEALSYGLLTHLHPSPLKRVEAAVSFNYLGQFTPVGGKSEVSQLLEGTATETTGRTSAPGAVRPHFIDIVAVVNEGKIRITWLYSQNIHNKTTMELLKQHFHSKLQNLISGKEKNVGITASDFPESNLSKKDMQKVLQLLQKKSKGR